MNDIDNKIEEFENRNTMETVPYGGTPSCQTPSSMVELAITKGYEPAFIEKMMDLQERNDARIAKQEYNKAMAKFKANPPKVWRDMQVKYEVGQKLTEWSHADLGVASEAINKGLAEHGLNSTWRLLPLEGNKTRVTCIIAHELGHSEETYLEAAPDATGSKNAIQAVGSTVFYLERYTLFAMTGLAPVRMDDDGQKGGIEYITLDMQTEIYDLIKSTKADKAKVLKYLGAESIETILLSEYGKAKVAFEAKKKEPIREPGSDDN